MNKVLLVGGSGYLGRHLRASLVYDFEVFYSGRQLFEKENYFCIDFANEHTFNTLLGYSFDLIFILAADLSGLGKTEIKKEFLQPNTTDYGVFLDFLASHKIAKKLVYISSMTVYDADNTSPVSEEAKTINPPNIYGLSKRIGEQITTFYCYKNEVKGVCFRIPGLFGGDRKSGYVFNAIQKISMHQDFQINTKGLIYWECASVVDIAEMIASFIKVYSWESIFDIYNLSYGKETDIVKVAEIIKEKLNSSSEIIEISEKGYCPFYLDNRKAKSFIPIEKKLSDAIDNYINSVKK